MTLIEAVKTCLRKYATFSGRASRSEFWLFILACMLFSMVLTIVNSAIFGPQEATQFVIRIDDEGNKTQGVVTGTHYNAGWLGTIFGLAVLLPTIAAACRRLHDSGRSGWYLLLPVGAGLLVNAALWFSLTPVAFDPTGLDPSLDYPATISVPIISPMALFAVWLIGFGSVVITIVWLCRRSSPGSNRYGPNPFEVTP